MDSIKRYLYFVKPYKWRILVTVILGIIKFTIPLLMPLLIKYVIDDIIDTNLTVDEKMTRLLIVMGIAFLIFGILRPPVEYYRQYLAQWVSSKILYDIREKMFDHIQKLSLKYYSKTKTGEIISRVINDVEQTKNFVVTGLMNIWLDMVTILIAIGIMISIDPLLTLAAIILFPFYGFSVKYFYSRLRKLTRERSQALAEVQGHLHERVQGIPVTRGFALEDYEQKSFNKQNGKYLDRALAFTSWNAKSYTITHTITDIAPLIVIGFGGYAVINGSVSLGSMVAFVSYISLVYNPLRRLVNSSTILTQAHASMDRVFEFLDVPYDIVDSPNAKTLTDIHGNVDFENVSFKYDEEEAYVLKNVSLNVKKGETIALVGMSGGGK